MSVTTHLVCSIINFLIAIHIDLAIYSGYLKTSPTHELWGETFGVVCWLWIFYRARQDLPVVLGWRHPWEHDSHDDHHHDEHEEH
jgi:uncharacterized membrane protein YagU involved in acid resistance